MDRAVHLACATKQQDGMALFAGISILMDFAGHAKMVSSVSVRVIQYFQW
jgi:hypothetical protein